MALWVAQLALNFVWSPVMFTLHAIAPAFLIILAMLTLIFAFIAGQWSQGRFAAWLFVPYACWASYAASLNAAILHLN
jgi:tryptophan-rich sensory protein